MKRHSKFITTMAIPSVKKMIVRIINMVALHIRRASGTGSVHGCQETPHFGGNLNATSRRSETKWGSAEMTPITAIKPSALLLPQGGAAPHRQLVPPTAASLPRRLLLIGVGSKATLRNNPHTQVAIFYCLAFSPDRGGLSHPFCVTVYTVRNCFPIIAAIFWLKGGE